MYMKTFLVENTRTSDVVDSRVLIWEFYIYQKKSPRMYNSFLPFYAETNFTIC